MDILLGTLLRRDDLVSLKFADVHDRFLWVIPQKTEGSTLVKLKMRVGEQLATILALARDAVLSLFVIHRLPDRAPLEQTGGGAPAPHPGQA